MTVYLGGDLVLRPLQTAADAVCSVYSEKMASSWVGGVISVGMLLPVRCSGAEMKINVHYSHLDKKAQLFRFLFVANSRLVSRLQKHHHGNNLLRSYDPIGASLSGLDFSSISERRGLRTVLLALKAADDGLHVHVFMVLGVKIRDKSLHDGQLHSDKLRV